MTKITISGMRCGHCVASVTKALEAIDGISNVQVDLDKGEASFENTADVNLDTAKEAIRSIGFEPN